MEIHIGVAELRDRLGKRIDAAHYRGEPTVIEKNGEPRAVIVPYDWWAAAREREPESGSERLRAPERQQLAPPDHPMNAQATVKINGKTTQPARIPNEGKAPAQGEIPAGGL